MPNENIFSILFEEKQNNIDNEKWKELSEYDLKGLIESYSYEKTRIEDRLWKIKEMIQNSPDEILSNNDILEKLKFTDLDNDTLINILNIIHTFALTDWNICENEWKYIDLFKIMHWLNSNITIDDLVILDKIEIKLIIDNLITLNKDKRLSLVRWLWLIINSNWIKDENQILILNLLSNTRFWWYRWHIYLK